MLIQNYNSSALIAKVCFNEETTSDNFHLLRFSEEKCYIHTDTIKSYDFIKSENEKLNSGDTVLIYQNGYVRKLFDCTSYSQTIITTNRCSSNCIMCPYTSNQRKHSENQNIDLLLGQIDYLPNDTAHLVVTGGEPTLIGFDFFRFMSKIKTHFSDIVCLLLTNGRTFANHNTVRLAKETFPVMTQIAIPIHSADADLHDAITQSKDSFNQTANAVARLLAENFFIEIRIVVSGLNINSMDGIAELIINRFPKVSLVNFMGVEMCGNASINSNIVWTDYNTAFRKCETAIEKLIKFGIDVGIYNFPLCSVPVRFHGIYKKSISDYKVRYSEKCKNCIKKELCGGFFASSLKYAQDSVIPYI